MEYSKQEQQQMEKSFHPVGQQQPEQWQPQPQQPQWQPQQPQWQTQQQQWQPQQQQWQVHGGPHQLQPIPSPPYGVQPQQYSVQPMVTIPSSQPGNAHYNSGAMAAIVFGVGTVLITVGYLACDLARIVQVGTAIHGVESWFCIIFLSSGILGILAGRRRTKGFIVSVLVLSILSMILVPSGWITYNIDAALGWGAKLTKELSSSNDDLLSIDGRIEHIEGLEREVVNAATYVIAMFVLGAFLFAAALGSSISACVALCRCCEKQDVIVDRVILTDADVLAINA